MKIVASMQPYFFPYIGYWQLIYAADCFVLFDVCQYIRHGWVSRNRILKPAGGWQYITVPLRKYSMNDMIKEVYVSTQHNWKEKIINQLEHYKKKARYFSETNELVKHLLFDNNAQSIGDVNGNIIRELCVHLAIKTEIITASRYDFDFSEVSAPGDWALRESEQLGATEYINPIAGAELCDQKKFCASNIKLGLFESNGITYPQPGTFEPSLSIIDVLMFNGIEGTKKLLKDYNIKRQRSEFPLTHRVRFSDLSVGALRLTGT